MDRTALRIGVYSDLVYRRDEHGCSSNRAFVRFACALAPQFGELVLIGRVDPRPGRAAYAIPPPVRIAALPYYRSARDPLAVLRALVGSCRAFWRALAGLDVVWVFGPQPLSLPFVLLARLRRTPLVLGVRHDYPRYIAGRLPNPRWRWAIAIAALMDRLFRLASRSAPAVVLGEPLARRYAGGAPVLQTGFSLVAAGEVRDRADALARDWDEDPIDVLTVSRLDPEKNPWLLLDIAAALRGHERRWRLRIAGDGPLRAELEHAARDRGLTAQVAFAGELANGPELWAAYRAAHAFLHVSWTEGLPQVLLEAQAAGLPIVATAVGGVAAALDEGRSGILIEPGDAGAAVRGLERLAAERALRERLIETGLACAREQTLEAQTERVAAFLTAAVGDEEALTATAGPRAVAANILRTAAATRAMRALARIDRPGAGLLHVLMYHRVDDPGRDRCLDPGLISATPADFEQQMTELARSRPVVGLDAVLAAVRERCELPAGAVLVTFDDAYRDFDANAWPVLHRLGLPVTVFVPTAYPGDPARAFWWDRVHAAIETTERRELVATPAGTLDLRPGADLRVARIAVRDWVWSIPDDEAMDGIAAIERELGVGPRAGEVLDWRRLGALAGEGVTLAAHTRTHPRLDQVTASAAVAEVLGSIEDLRAHIGAAPPAIAYPGGGHTDALVGALRAAGVELGFTTERGSNDLRGADPLRLRRINVGRASSPALIAAQMLPTAVRLRSRGR